MRRMGSEKEWGMEKKEKNWIGSGREGKYRDGVGE